jgi:hypothetical protein
MRKRRRRMGTPTLWSSLLVWLAIWLLISACAQEECEQQAFVENVQVEMRDGDYYALFQGTLQDACTKVDEIRQEVDGSTIKLTVCTTRPEDLLCAQVLAPFEEEVLLDVSDLSTGQYTVEANGTVTTLTYP